MKLGYLLLKTSDLSAITEDLNIIATYSYIPRRMFIPHKKHVLTFGDLHTVVRKQLCLDSLMKKTSWKA